MPKKKKTEKIAKKTVPVLAKSDDGTIQITFTIAYREIAKSRKLAISEIGKDITVPGFRKGKAPLNKLIEHIPQNTLLEKTLSTILPNLLNEVVKKHDLKLAVYPKYELVKAVDGEDWQIRAKTAEVPEISLGDYKSKVAGALRAKTIWTPSSAQSKEVDPKKQPTRAEKEQIVIEALINNINLKIPEMLIDEEVNSRLSQLLQRLEKLGLNLESYLSSIGKTAEQLRDEYKKQAKESISLNLSLSKIADTENIKIDEKQLKQALNISKADDKLTKELENERSKKLLEEVLRKREVLNMLIALT